MTLIESFPLALRSGRTFEDEAESREPKSVRQARPVSGKLRFGAAPAIACLMLGLAIPCRAEGDKTCKALEMSNPTDADLEKCLDPRPWLIGGLVLSLTLGGEDGYRTTVLGQADVLKIPRVYLSGRARYGEKYGEFDLLSGYALFSEYGFGNATNVSMSNEYRSSGTSYTQTTTARTREAVVRSSFLLLGGIRATYLDPGHYGEPKHREFSSFPTWTFGIGRHEATHDEGQSRIELLGHLYDGSMGFSAKWFNKIVGMEAGWVPVQNGTDGQGRKNEPFSMFYWNFIDVGFFMDLL